MVLQQLLLTKNNCYIKGTKIKPAGIMVHSTGANNPHLKRYVNPDDGKLGVNISRNSWNQPLPDGRQVCVHAFIGKLADGSVATYQTLPWDTRGWHAGGSANNTHIGFEICEDALTDSTYFTKVYQEAVDLCAMLCATYKIPPEKPALICHSEGYKLGIASNHGDVMHWFPKFGKSMDTFREDVKKAMDSADFKPQVDEKPGEDMLVLSETEVTLGQAEAWAKESKATDTFVKLAAIYWDKASLVGVNPALAYAQSALETGYGKFSGVINDSYCNPCGMKVAKGGDDYDKDAHFKFDSWEDGVSAHVDHIALYAGADGYPRADSKDPRGFSYLMGKGKTLDTLSEGWCPGNPNYAEILLSLMDKMLDTEAAEPERTPEEITVDNAFEDGIITGKEHWLGVLNGVIEPVKEYIKSMMDNAHEIINKKK